MSFDDNRISTTCTELKLLSAEFEQIIVLTHYKTVIRHLLNYKAKAVYAMIVRDAGGSKLVQLDTKGFCLSDHEKAYLKLAEFVNRKSDNRGNPRQFMERHLDLVFQPQLSIIRRAQPFLTLSDKITELEKAQALPAEIAKKLHAYREALNPDHHDDDHDKAVEDARNNTKQMLDVLYLLPT